MQTEAVQLCGVYRKAEVREFLSEPLEYDPALQPAKRRTEAEVDAVAECDLAVDISAVDVEAVGIVENGRVAIGSPQ